jgi:hypothetical protein
VKASNGHSLDMKIEFITIRRKQHLGRGLKGPKTDEIGFAGGGCLMAKALQFIGEHFLKVHLRVGSLVFLSCPSQLSVNTHSLAVILPECLSFPFGVWFLSRRTKLSHASILLPRRRLSNRSRVSHAAILPPRSLLSRRNDLEAHTKSSEHSSTQRATTTCILTILLMFEFVAISRGLFPKLFLAVTLAPCCNSLLTTF